MVMRPRTVLAVCSLVAAGLASYVALSPGGLPRLSAQRAEVAGLEADVEALKQENATLAREARLLQGEGAEARPYLEKAVREDLGWVKKDEHLLLLPRLPNQAEDEERAVAPEAAP